MKRSALTLFALTLIVSVFAFGQLASPTNLTATFTNSSNAPAITLAWQYGTTAMQVKFNIYKKEGPAADTGHHYVMIGDTRDKHFNDNGFRPGVTYSYYVTAQQQRTESAPSNTADVTVPLPPSGIISGLVSEDSTGLPLGHAMITVLPVPTAPGEPLSVMTDSSGYFKIRVKAGAYYLYTAAMGHVSEYYDNVSTIQHATSLTINANDSVGVTIGLAKVVPPSYGVISGIVLADSSSTPVRNATVNFLQNQYPTFATIQARTDSNGYFKIRVFTATYHLYTTANGYVAEYYDNVPTFDQATAIPLQANDSIGVTISLAKVPPPGVGIISGTVTDDSSSLPVAHAHVYVIPGFNAAPGPVPVPVDSNGFFKVPVRSGKYYLYTDAPQYQGEYYDNAATMSQATAITVNANDSLGFSIGLGHLTPPTMYTISGWVKNSSGAPQRASVTGFLMGRNPGPGDDHRMLSVMTDSLGNYSLTVRANDSVVLFYQPFSNAFQSQYWNHKQTFAAADRVPVTGNLTGFNVTLDSLPTYANGISGTVKDSTGATPLKGFVYAYKKAGNKYNYTRYYALSDSTTGAYSISSMEPGTYIFIGFSPNYKATYFRYDGTRTLDWRQADTVVVAASGVVSGINFRLIPLGPQHSSSGSTVQGNVKGRSGNALEAAVTIALDGNGEIAGCAISQPDGSFTIEGLAAGDYTLITNLASYQDAQTSAVTVGDATSSQVDVVMSTESVTSVPTTSNTVVSTYRLSQNYPNPFNPTTQISFDAPKSGVVTVKVYNILGNEVATLLSGEVSAGTHQVTFNGDNLPSGIYYVKLEAGSSFISMKKMMLIK